MQHNQQKTKSKQNITRVTEVKNNLTIARGEGGGDSGQKVSHHYHKNTWRKPRWRVEAREGGGFGWNVGECWGENAATVIEQQ